ncbi:YggS family pyridoxal phosphate enzyme [Acetobacter aceti]|uniref:Pyridoxal phosphate homeostasis protein n=2 Tax=Acetobacter aceti TaxID=435 RepID=A0A1U9KH92_ACEAC|nr:YggS family pyridoxal phosphate enzyme [Acetobacter aceti]
MTHPHSDGPLVEMVASDISRALRDVRTQIEKAVQDAGRPADAVTLVAVSKFHPAAAVEAALLAGQRVFGENRVQEAAEKFPSFREQYPDLRLHLIGGLQTNKAREAVRIADVIESLDRPSLSDALAKAADQEGRMPDLLIEVNTGDEPQKFGVLRENADEFIRQSRARFGEKLRGLMCIPPAGEDPVPHFRFLRSLADQHGLPVRSMGMSADYPQAIAEGATLVRVGTAIFGARPSGVAAG